MSRAPDPPGPHREDRGSDAPVAPEAATSGDLSPRHHRLALLAIWVRNAGALIVLFAAWQVWGTGFEQARAQRQLGDRFTSALAAAPPAQVGSGPAAVATPTAPLGQAVARVRIPNIGVDQFVVEGTKVDDLKKGPGHYGGSALPGEPGNAAVAGHRTTFGAPFNRLDELKPGDPVIANTPKGEFTYLVSEPPRSVSPEDIGVVNEHGDDRLTLTTCDPKYSAARRLIVVAKPAPAPPPAAATPAAPQVRPAPLPRPPVADDSGWHWSALPVALMWLAAVVALGLAYRRLAAVWPRTGRLLVLVPVWALSLLVLFEALNRLLPSNV